MKNGKKFKEEIGWLMKLAEIVDNLYFKIHNKTVEYAEKYLKEQYPGIEFKPYKSGGKNSFPDIQPAESSQHKVYAEIITSRSKQAPDMDEKIPKLIKMKGDVYIFVINKNCEKFVKKAINKHPETKEIKIVNLMDVSD